MKLPKLVCVDFETFAIGPRPASYPPEPVGVAIKWPGKKSRYYAWGHRGGKNNCTKGEAAAALEAAWQNPDGLLLQNAKFDLEVADAHFGIGLPPWQRIHDLLFLLFLDDPFNRNLGLKPSAEHYLKWAPEERDAIAEWLVKAQPVAGERITYKNAIAHVAYAPGDVAGAYACGDTDRTEALFRHLWPRVVVERGMGAAYDRERRVMPILLEMERRGVRVHEKQLAADVERYDAAMVQVDAWLRQRLEIGPGVNLDSAEELAAALVEAGVVESERMEWTPKSNRLKTDKKSLEAGVIDPALYGVLRYRTQLGTCLGTFMRPWLAAARGAGGLIYTSWNQTRGDSNGGARTGRLSSGGKTASAGNFQNIPKEFDGIALPIDLPPLPLCRQYIAPHARGEVLAGRDYQGQELRVLGHYEDNQLLRAYQADPWLDVHEHARVQINDMLGRNYKRGSIKNLGFSIIYGSGAPGIAMRMDVPVETAAELKKAYMKTFPGLADLYSDTKRNASSNVPIKTWGGREYYCEESRIVDGRIRSFDYKLVNYLIQGSSADCTKQALINFDAVADPEWKLIMQVHDEIVMSVPKRDLRDAMECLRGAMSDVEFDVPMLSEGEYGNSWGSMESWDAKGVIVHKRKAA